MIRLFLDVRYRQKDCLGQQIGLPAPVRLCLLKHNFLLAHLAYQIGQINKRPGQPVGYKDHSTQQYNERNQGIRNYGLNVAD
ncbi:hypothetical protein D3C87_1919040 [compost metagenome]